MDALTQYLHDYAATFLAALSALQSHASSSDERRGASDWLIAFQSTHECWEVAKRLLMDPATPVDVQVRGRPQRIECSFHSLCPVGSAGSRSCCNPPAIPWTSIHQQLLRPAGFIVNPMGYPETLICFPRHSLVLWLILIPPPFIQKEHVHRAGHIG